MTYDPYDPYDFRRERRQRRYAQLRHEENAPPGYFNTVDARALNAQERRFRPHRGKRIYVNGLPQVVLQKYTNGNKPSRYDTDEGTLRRTNRGWTFREQGDNETSTSALPVVHISFTRPKERR